jgi:probable HAF family extracellular repeat protein
MIDLGTLGGATSSSIGKAINNHGQIVGSASSLSPSDPTGAFIYSNGQMTNLNSLIDPSLGIRGSDGRVYAVLIAIAGGKVRAGQPQPLFTIDAEARAAIHSVVSFDVSSDGSRFVIPSMTPGERSAIVVLQNWESLVAK